MTDGPRVRLAVRRCAVLALAGVASTVWAQETAAGGQATTRRYVYVVRPAAEEIVVDGELKPDEWQFAAPVAGFRALVGGHFVRNQTLIRMLYDWEALYIGITCYEDSIEKLLVAGQDGDAKLLDGDCAEWWLGVGPDPKRIVRMVVNPSGAKSADVGAGAPWGKDWAVAAKRSKAAWSIEVKVPFASLGVETPALFDLWRFNLVRHRRAGLQTPEMTTWAELAPEAPGCDFGRIMFSQQPLPDGASPLDGLNAKTGGPSRVYGDLGYVDVDTTNMLYRYSDLLGAVLRDKMPAGGKLAALGPAFEQQPDHPQAAKYYRTVRQWDGLVRDVQAAQSGNGVSALAWVWGTLDVLEMSGSIDELYRSVAVP